MNEGSTQQVPGWAKGLLSLDTAMAVAIFTALVWVGKETQRIDTMAESIVTIQHTIDDRVKVNDANSASVTVDINDVKMHQAQERQQIKDLQEFVSQRLDRIERKLDAK